MDGGALTMPVRVKRAEAEDGIARLRHEAEILERLRHPGVVELVELVDRDDSTELRVTAIAGVPLAEADPLSVEEIAGLLSAVTATLADLHAAGVVHRNLDASHVIVRPDGGPVLCGFGAAGRVEDGADPADDVRAVGRMITALLGQMDGDGGRRGRNLAAIARNAVELPPPASVLAASLAARIEGSCLPGAAKVAAPSSEPSVTVADLLRAAPRRRVSRRALLFTGIVVLAGVAVVPTLTRPRPAPPRAVAVAAPATTTTARPVTTTVVAVRVWPSSTTTATSTTASVVVSDGTVLHDGERWLIGDPGDIVVTGDWKCTGTETAALLRPASGAVFVFAGWTDRAAASLGTVEGATALEAVDRDGDGCHELVVTRAAGEPVVLDV